MFDNSRNRTCYVSGIIFLEEDNESGSDKKFCKNGIIDQDKNLRRLR